MKSPALEPVNEQRMRDEGGFTLIALMIAVTILTIGLLAIAKSQSALYHAQNDSAMRAVAYSIARSYGEDVRGRAAADIVSEGATAINSQGVLDVNGTYRRSMTVVAESQRLSRVTISVTYPSGRNPVQLVTLIYR